MAVYFHAKLKQQIYCLCIVVRAVVLYVSCENARDGHSGARVVSSPVVATLPGEKYAYEGLAPTREQRLSIVLVVSSFADSHDQSFANGVLIGYDNSKACMVLSCAHAVRRDHKNAADVRVRIREESLDVNMDGTGDFNARIVALNEINDLVLLEVDGCKPLYRICVPVHAMENTVTEYHVASLNLQGALTVSEGWFLRFHEGQSGSPVFQNRVFVGIARGMIGPRGGFGSADRARVSEIVEFVRSVDGAPVCVAE